jgi:hypothetical protein
MIDFCWALREQLHEEGQRGADEATPNVPHRQ